MRKYKRALTWFAIVVVLIALSWATLWQFYFRPWQQFSFNAHTIQIAVERYAVDTDGSYPADVQVLISRGYFHDWPLNPIGPGRMQPLAPDDPPVPGCFVYIPAGPVITDKDGKSQPNRDAALGPSSHTEVESYLLVFYGRGENNNYKFGLSGDPIADQARQKIRWDKVAIIFESGHNWK